MGCWSAGQDVGLEKNDRKKKIQPASIELNKMQVEFLKTARDEIGDSKLFNEWLDCYNKKDHGCFNQSS